MGAQDDLSFSASRTLMSGTSATVNVSWSAPSGYTVWIRKILDDSSKVPEDDAAVTYATGEAAFELALPGRHEFEMVARSADGDRHSVRETVWLVHPGAYWLTMLSASVCVITALFFFYVSAVQVDVVQRGSFLQGLQALAWLGGPIGLLASLPLTSWFIGNARGLFSIRPHSIMASRRRIGALTCFALLSVVGVVAWLWVTERVVVENQSKRSAYLYQIASGEKSDTEAAGPDEQRPAGRGPTAENELLFVFPPGRSDVVLRKETRDFLINSPGNADYFLAPQKLRPFRIADNLVSLRCLDILSFETPGDVVVSATADVEPERLPAGSRTTTRFGLELEGCRTQAEDPWARFQFEVVDPESNERLKLAARQPDEPLYVERYSALVRDLSVRRFVLTRKDGCHPEELVLLGDNFTAFASCAETDPPEDKSAPKSECSMLVPDVDPTYEPQLLWQVWGAGETTAEWHRPASNVKEMLGANTPELPFDCTEVSIPTSFGAGEIVYRSIGDDSEPELLGSAPFDSTDGESTTTLFIPPTTAVEYRYRIGAYETEWLSLQDGDVRTSGLQRAVFVRAFVGPSIEDGSPLEIRDIDLDFTDPESSADVSRRMWESDGGPGAPGARRFSARIPLGLDPLSKNDIEIRCVLSSGDETCGYAVGQQEGVIDVECSSECR